MKHIVDRERELRFLEEKFASAKPQLLVMYGRRRAGKTFLLEHFLEKHDGAYFLCSRGNEAEQIALLSKTLAEYYGDAAVKINPFKSWDQLFDYLSEKAEAKRLVLVIDEFPYLIQSNNAVPSIFQKYWDTVLSKTNAFLVLCGSSIGMMESQVLAHKSPLYGRRTGQWKVESFRFNKFRQFFKKTSVEQAIEFYAVLGGIPYYAGEFDEDASAKQNILAHIARKGELLYEEGEFLVKEELSDAHTYFSILRAIAEGKTKQSEIANSVGMNSTAMPRYLNKLASLGFVARATPTTMAKNSKKSIYSVSDAFLKFWFKFVYPNRGLIETEKYGEMATLLDRDFNAFTGKAFETVCREFVEETGEYDEAGPWWTAYRDKDGVRAEEIDIVATNRATDSVLFAECKWQAGADADALLADLKRKARLVEWRNAGRKEKYALFAKSFKENSNPAKEAVLIDLQILSKWAEGQPAKL